VSAGTTGYAWTMTEEQHRATTAATCPDPGSRPTGPPGDRPLVLVTGGSGMLGAGLVRRLQPTHQVVSLDLAGDPTSPSDAEFICTDLTDDDSVARAVERVRDRYGERVASVVHLAAYYDFGGADSPLYDEITVEGTRRLLDALQNLRLEQFVFSSTMLVHRPSEPGREIDEGDPVDRSWPYPRSKVDTEQMVREHPLSERTSVVLARLAGVYDEDGHSPPLTNQIKRIDGRWPTSHLYPAGLDRGQSFIHRDDAIAALARIVERRAELPRCFPVLLGEPRTVGYGDLQDAIARELHGHDWATYRIPVPLAKVGAWLREHNPVGQDPFIRSWMIDHAGDHYDLDLTAARSQLDWRPEHDVVDTIPEMVRRLREDREGWYAENDLRPPRRLLPA
jgi:nucleoside-diphosphate-sugar epimerase